MPLSNDQYCKVQQLLGSGLSAGQIASRVGCKASHVYNVKAGRIKPPAEKRKDAGETRYSGMDTFVAAVREEYISQGKRKNNLSTCIDTAKHRLIATGNSSSALFASESTIYRHVSRAYKAEKWDLLFDFKKMKQSFQTALPKLHYDYWKLVGFNDWWVIDGRKSDQWVIHPETGHPVQPQGYYIMELKTRSMLHVSWSLDSFDAFEVITILLKLALEFGPPNRGIFCDNGMEQIGRDNVLAMEAFWPQEIIEAYRAQAIPEVTTFFPGATSPVITSAARIPTDFAKAALERSFATIQRRFDAMVAGDAYQGGGRGDGIHRTLTRVPKPSKTWNSWERFTQRMDWFFRATEPSPDGLLPYHAIEMPQALGGLMRTTGLIPTVANAVEVCLTDHSPRVFPAENYFRAAYYALPKLKNKRVTAIGQVTFRHKGDTLSYNCNGLDYTMLHERVDVVIDPNDPTRAGVFVAGRPVFLGVGIDIASRVNSGKVSVGQGREVMSKFRAERVAEVREAADAIKEKPHDVPKDHREVQPIQVIEMKPEKPLLDPEEVDFDEFSPEAQELLRQQ